MSSHCSKKCALFFVALNVKHPEKYSQKYYYLTLIKNSLNKKEDRKEKISKIIEYETKLPYSFLKDYSAPSSSSFMWLQRTGRLDLCERIKVEQKKKVEKTNSEEKFKLDPLFLSVKKTKKKLKFNSFSTIMIGEKREEKMIIFDLSKKKDSKFDKAENSKFPKIYRKREIRQVSSYFYLNTIYSQKIPKKQKIFFFMFFLGFSYLFKLL